MRLLYECQLGQVQRGVLEPLTGYANIKLGNFGGMLLQLRYIYMYMYMYMYM